MPNSLYILRDASLNSCPRLEGCVFTHTNPLQVSASVWQGETGLYAENRELVLDAVISRLGNYSLYNCGYTDITVGSASRRIASPTNIGDSAFSGQHTNSVTLYVASNSTAFNDQQTSRINSPEFPVEPFVINI